MITQSQNRKLSFLNEKIQECQKCKNLYKNGMAVPYWTRQAKYLILAEAPGEEEIQDDKRTPLVGKSGIRLFSELSRHKIKLKRKDFFILNTVQCRPIAFGGKNGKPSHGEMGNCKFWVEKYIEIFNPKIILVLGNYANEYFFGDYRLGITKESGKMRELDNGIKVMPCVHPASILYSSDNLALFRSTLKKFRKAINVL